MPGPKVDPQVVKMVTDVFKKVFDAAADAALEEVQRRLHEGTAEIDGRISRVRSKVGKKRRSSAASVIDAEFIDEPRRY